MPADTSGKTLSVLKQSQAIDDSAWVTDSTGTLYITESGSDLIWKVTGPFKVGSELVSVAPQLNSFGAPEDAQTLAFRVSGFAQILQQDDVANLGERGIRRCGICCRRFEVGEVGRGRAQLRGVALHL